MTNAIKLVTLLDVLLICLLTLSAYFGGWLGEALYYVAFLVPIIVGFYCSEYFKRKREEVAGVAEEPDELFSFSFGKAKTLLPLIAPTVAIVFTASLLTSLFLSLFGISSAPVENRNLLTMLVAHALAPAIMEELLFRYIPLKILMPYSKRGCIFYSALCFSLIHCSFSQMPYAFIAGVVFMMIDVALGSVWPSIILHFINNASSVVLMKYGSSAVGTGILLGVLAALVIVSVVCIVLKKKEYGELMRGAFDKGEAFVYTPALLALVMLCGYLAVTNL